MLKKIQSASTPRLENSVKIKVLWIDPFIDGFTDKLDFRRNVTDKISTKTPRCSVTS